MKMRFIAVFIFSISIVNNVMSDLESKPVNCNGRLIHWNLYQVSVSADASYEGPNDMLPMRNYNDKVDSRMGDFEFWMGFHRDGSMLPQLFLFAYDKYFDNSSNVSISSATLNISLNKTNWVRGCFAELTIRGDSLMGYGGHGGGNMADDFIITASGFISFENANNINNDMGFADRFTLRNAKIELGSQDTSTYHPSERKGGRQWEFSGEVHFTQIR